MRDKNGRFLKGFIHTEESKIKIGLASRGRKKSLETRRKLSNALMGRKLSELHLQRIRETRVGMLGKNHSAQTKRKIGKANFKDSKNYFVIHSWIGRHFGKPSKCENCGKSGLKKLKIHWANISKKYKRVRKDWFRLCAKCHKNYDLNKIKIKQKYANKKV